MEGENKINQRAEKLKKFIIQNDEIRTRLLDAFRSNEMSEKEYYQEIQKTDESFKTFIKNNV